MGIETAPALKGYVRFITKPTADTILKVDEKDPLLVRWQYGLGRAVVFTSDAKSRWAADWVTWKGFDKLWTNIFRDLLPHAESGEAKTEYDSASGDLIVNYQLGATWKSPPSCPEFSFWVPAASDILCRSLNSPTKPIAEAFTSDSCQGLFRIRPLEESRAFPEVGYYQPGAGTAGLRLE